MIRAAEYRSKFCDSPHLNLWVNGEPIQEWLHRQVPAGDLEGLVPAWLGWLNEDAEREIVRERMFPRVGETQLVPLLVCPDDLDFSCTLVIAEVSATGEDVVWERLGLDRTRSPDPSDVGTQVEWFAIPSIRFPRAVYLECVKRFGELQPAP
ncbi:hypothetical protein [Luteolibacter sp. Populi]|uniref:hypothetical protein n=1 Tax=Luteolibacter sp. Populi TaxID=3230487 RepID=UPI003464FFB6